LFLKSLTLNGFKSFYEKVDFYFEPGITVIVGPNGCGKTNIAEALYWVLGEQSARALRSSKMEEVIFNGSERRKPLGFAEVTLTLSNTDKLLPIDYSEVVISRRVFRSGESEYFINKKPCRLRDITELFLDTGLVTGGYSLMGQGRVELILSSRPEERRSVFEEAAGVMKYKAKRKEALRKLDATEQNLLRVNDILSEVKTQMISLARQANRARRYQEIKEEIKKLELAQSYSLFKKIDQEITSLEKDVSSHQEAIEKLTTQVNLKDAEIESVSLKATNLEKASLSAQGKFFEITQKIEKAEAEARVSRERIENITRRRQELENEVKRKQEKKEELANILETLLKEKTKFNNALKELKEKIAFKKQTEKELYQKLLSLQETLEEGKAEIVDELKIIASLNNNLVKLETEEKAEARALEKLNIQKSSLETKLLNTTQELSQVENEVVSLKEKGRSLEEQIEEQSTAQKSLSAKLSQRKEEQARLIEESHSLSSRLSSLEELQRNYEGYSEGTRQVVKLKETNPQILDTLGNLIECSPEVQSLVELALDEMIEYVIVEKEEDVTTLATSLKEKTKGWAVFLPLELTSKTMPRSREFGFPSLAEICKLPQKIKEIGEKLLSAIIIIPTLEEALKHLSSASNPLPYRIVTRDGFLVTSWGSIKTGTKITKGVINRKIQIEKLKEEKEIIENQLSKVEKEVRSIETLLKEVSLSLENLQGSFQELQAKLLEKEKEQVLLEKEVKKLEGERQFFTQEEIFHQKELTKIRETLSHLKNEISQKTLQHKEKELQVKEKGEALQEYQSKNEEIKQELVTLQVELASQEASYTQLLEKEKETQETLQEIEREIQAKELTQDELQHQKSLLEKTLIEIEREIKRAFEERAEQEEETKELKNKQEEVRVKIQEFKERLDTLRQDLEKHQGEVYEKELKLVELRTKKQTLVSQTREKYNLEIENFSPADVTLKDDTGEQIKELKEKLNALEPINLMAIEEYEEQKKRYQFLKTQRDDLVKAKRNLLEIIQEINSTTEKMFLENFEKVAVNFNQIFRKLFGGGKAELKLAEPGNVLESGIEIFVTPPGKKLQSIALLSGGEKALVAIALLFAIFKVKPSPFSFLDEIDAALDDVNIGRFTALLREFSQTSQFIIITHNKRTMEIGDALYGITMEEPGISKVVSVRFNSSRVEKKSVTQASI
jgi:chromosome segregation protein